MNAINKSLFGQIGGTAVVNNIIDVFYGRMLDDYRVNRFFNSSDEHEQTAALKAFIHAALGGSNNSADEIKDLLDDFFLHAFARNKRKSFVAGSDWGFFDMVIEQDKPSTLLLCNSHAHLLRFMPDDSNYDAVEENLSATLKQLNINKTVGDEILKLAESVRKAVLGEE